MAADEDDDFAEFLAKVNEIDSLVKGLSSDDKHQSAQALEEADKYLNSQQDFSKTVINRSTGSTSVRDTSANEVSNGSERDAFCESVEQDASERAERRLEREKKGRELKGAGNAAFRSGQFDTAVERYSAAIESTPWDASLYTNRAQAYCHLSKHERAINDCNQALKVDPKSLKAYIHKGKALAALGRHKEALECYSEADRVLPEFAKTIQGYRMQLESLSEGKTSHM